MWISVGVETQRDEDKNLKSVLRDLCVQSR